MTVSPGFSGNVNDKRPEIVLALIAPLGIDLKPLSALLANEFSAHGYQTEEIRLAEIISRHLASPDSRGSVGAKERLLNLMDAGNKLREQSGRADILALLAASEIRDRRSVPDSPEERGIDPPVAWLLSPLKNSAELKTLRSIYGARLFALGVYSPIGRRRQDLAKKFEDEPGRLEPDAGQKSFAEAADELIERDADEGDSSGQQVEQTFHLADAFVNAAVSESEESHGAWENEVARLVRVLMGDPFVTPTRDEHAMFQAAGAAARSASPSRQVGAAITTPKGSILSLGCNEVPKYGGGTYWEGDQEDAREFVWSGSNSSGAIEQTNDRVRREIARRILERLREIMDPPDGDEKAPSVTTSAGKLLEATVDELSAISEFGRAVHAEMTAILDAAMRGVPLAGSTIYTTTFPCHNCTKHMIAAGILRVCYVAPYSKSRAGDLHGDAVEIEPVKTSGNRIAIERFVGVGPRRYLELFGQDWRAAEDLLPGRVTSTGEVMVVAPEQRVPPIPNLEGFPGVEDSHLTRERSAVEQLTSLKTVQRG